MLSKIEISNKVDRMAEIKQEMAALKSESDSIDRKSVV